MISFNEVTFKYKNSAVNALNKINLIINDGDFIGVTGNSGAGKTTLTYAINGIIPHHYDGDFYGAVKINDIDTVETKPEEISKLVGSVFQDVDAQSVASVVEDELLFGLENFGVPHKDIEDRIIKALDMVGISGLRNSSLARLSGGQKQKVSIAAILALEPSIIVLDEPTGELDPQSSRQVFEILKQLNGEHGITIIIVEQKIMLLCEYVKRLFIMDKGRICLSGSVNDVISEHAKMKELGINVPRVSDLGTELIKRSLYNGKLPVNIDQAYTMVSEVIK